MGDPYPSTHKYTQFTLCAAPSKNGGAAGPLVTKLMISLSLNLDVLLEGQGHVCESEGYYVGPPWAEGAHKRRFPFVSKAYVGLVVE
jgi:hypothetical protein